MTWSALPSTARHRCLRRVAPGGRRIPGAPSKDRHQATDAGPVHGHRTEAPAPLPCGPPCPSPSAGGTPAASSAWQGGRRPTAGPPVAARRRVWRACAAGDRLRGGGHGGGRQRDATGNASERNSTQRTRHAPSMYPFLRDGRYKKVSIIPFINEINDLCKFILSYKVDIKHIIGSKNVA
jgi:hypothetical protein